MDLIFQVDKSKELPFQEPLYQTHYTNDEATSSLDSESVR